MKTVLLSFLSIKLLILMVGCTNHNPPPTTPTICKGAYAKKANAIITGKAVDYFRGSIVAKTYVIDEHGHATTWSGLWGEPGSKISVWCVDGKLQTNPPCAHSEHLREQ